MSYELPTPAELKAFYPAFAAVPDDTIQLYIDRVSGPGGDVDQSWPEGVYKAAVMAAAAHRMARNGVLSAGASGGGSGGGESLDGVTSFKSGTFSVQISEAYVKAQVQGGWESTTWGQDYLELLERVKRGPRVTAPGVVPCCDGYRDGPFPWGWGC